MNENRVYLSFQFVSFRFVSVCVRVYVIAKNVYDLAGALELAVAETPAVIRVVSRFIGYMKTNRQTNKQTNNK